MYADFNYLVKDNITYTVDMLRLKTSITYEQFELLKFHIGIAYRKIVDNEYQSCSISEFRFNYHITVEEGESYWFGYFHNSEIYNSPTSASNNFAKRNFTIEFNPNKVKISGLLKYILNMSTDWTIKSVDIAMDIPVNILDICGFDKCRKKDIRIFSCGYDDKTIYMGRTNNRIKIYNKKIEAGLDKDLTRVEISSKLDLNIRNIMLYIYDVKLPELYLNQYLYTFADYEDKTLLAILYAVQYGYNLNDLTRRYKDKVKNLLRGNYKIELSNNCCTQIIQRCIVNIFNYLK